MAEGPQTPPTAVVAVTDPSQDIDRKTTEAEQLDLIRFLMWRLIMQIRSYIKL